MSHGPTAWLEHFSLPAPAKLNLFLHITGRRADGYHTLQTLFQFIDQADTLHFSRRADDRIQLQADMPGVEANDNLIIRAALALQKSANCHLGADIRLDKTLPMDIRTACTPKEVADAKSGQWNRFVITLRGDRVDVARWAVRRGVVHRHRALRGHAGGPDCGIGRDPSGRVVVGIDKGTVFERVTKDLTFQLDVGDCLLLYTDGVNEALDTKGLEFGEERIHATLSSLAGQGPQAVVDGLVSEVDRFLNGKRGHDDITLVVLQKT